MTYSDAINILDMRRAGADMPQSIVDKALELTGDLEPDIVKTAIEEFAEI